MFAKVFTQIFDSSLADDYQVRLVFEDFLKLADKRGVVDMTPEAIARRTNVPIDIVRRGITALEADDHRSRTPDQKGKRIVRLDAHRDWGWQIVNFAKYRESATTEMLRMAEADRKAEWRKRRNLPPKPPIKTLEAEREAEADMSHVRPGQSGTCPGHLLHVTVGNTQPVAGNGSKIESYKLSLGRAFKRKPGQAWSNLEESSLLECSRRPDFKSELDELLIFKAKPGSFFPQSISRLMSDWESTLDRARNHDERNHENTKPNPRNHGVCIPTAEKTGGESLGDFARRKANADSERRRLGGKVAEAPAVPPPS